MFSLLKYLLRRLLVIPFSLFIITALLYGLLMLSPAEERASLYLNAEGGKAQHLDQLIQLLIEQHGLRDPYPVQYGRWALNLLKGDWGWSFNLRSNVLEALARRTPATIELTLYSLLLFIPLGLAAGVIAGARQEQSTDKTLRLAAFVATAIPPFVLALIFLSIFYVALRWFPPERVGLAQSLVVSSPEFHTFTGMLTIDGFLNGRPDVSLDAFRHLVLPVITLSLVHWATLTRVTRISMIEEMGKEYITAAKGRGLSRGAILWRHALRNAMLPALNSAALSAASLVTGVFVVEAIYRFPGVSQLIVGSVAYAPDTPAAVGFAVYSVLVVLPLMLILDLIQAAVDPRIREGVTA